MQKLRRRSIVWVVGGFVALVVVVAIGLAVQAGGQWLNNLSVVVSVAVGLITAYMLFAGWASRPASVPSGQMADAADALARAQLELWSNEEGARRIDVPWALPVRWDVTARTAAIMVSWSAICATPGAGPLPLAGEFKTVADLFTPAAPRPLVILGDSGAGKTELLVRLVLDLLERRTSADPVPVLLSIAGWDPRQPLEEWIADQLAASHRWLAAPVNPAHGHTRTLAAALLADGRVLPVLDGMDEMAPAYHADAVITIGHFLTRRRQAVLTCGTAVYADAVAAAGPLTRTPVVEILPLAMSDVTTYLTDATQQAGDRWQTVVDHLLAADGTDPLAAALSTPLMVWLCRTVYMRATTTPAELLTAPWAATRAGIEDRLLGELTAAVYGRPRPDRRILTTGDIDDNQRWLAALARHLSTENSHDIAWWQLHKAVPRQALRTAAATTSFLAAALVTGFGLTAAYSPGTAVATSVVVGAVLGVIAFARTGSGHPPPEILLSSRRRGSGTTAAAVWSGLLWSAPPGVATWAALDAIFGAGPAMAGGLATAAVIGLARACTVALLHSADHRRAAGPAQLLRRACAAALFSRSLLVVGFSVAAGLAVLLAAPVVVSPAASLGVGLTLGVAVGLSTLVHTVWGQFCLVRVILAARGRTPLRLMRFLADAHQRGLVRQAGGVYQFRHSRLRDTLARHT